VVFDTVFDYTSGYEAASAGQRPSGVPGHPVTEVAAGSLAARRRRAVAERSATLGTPEPAFLGAARAGAGRPGDDLAEAAGAGTDLVVLLPSTDAATVLLLCAEAAGLSG
jgi:hypothetical protein